jgi:hypothetical protein
MIKAERSGRLPTKRSVQAVPLCGSILLQRIRNPKHSGTIQEAIQDTVELFGVNFQVSMETVFTTLEHTARMTQTTGENRDFKKSDLDSKRETLKQAIAATLEESLCAGGQREGSTCEYHSKLVKGLKQRTRLLALITTA